MKTNSRIRFLIIAILLVGGAALLLFSRGQTLTAEVGNVEFALQAPAFVHTASAQRGPNAITSVLDSEAGISAYFQAPSAINLDDVKDLYHTIEIETDGYILGSMTVPNNWEEYDVHVYIDESGWMLAYYLKDMPAVRIFDWQTWEGTMNPTRLQSVLNYVATALNLPTATLTYYDFRNPNATNLLLAVEDGPANVTHSFDILDTTFTYYESSWGVGGAHFGGCCWTHTSYYYVDGVEIHRNEAGNNVTRFDIGTLTTSQLPPGASHTISILMGSSPSATVMGALAIVYGP